MARLHLIPLLFKYCLFNFFSETLKEIHMFEARICLNITSIILIIRFLTKNISNI